MLTHHFATLSNPVQPHGAKDENAANITPGRASAKYFNLNFILSALMATFAEYFTRELALREAVEK